eukprot:14145598-Alexandrium_andersonii.AAC.1
MPCEVEGRAVQIKFEFLTAYSLAKRLLAWNAGGEFQSRPVLCMSAERAQPLSRCSLVHLAGGSGEWVDLLLAGPTRPSASREGRADLQYMHFQSGVDSFASEQGRGVGRSPTERVKQRPPLLDTQHLFQKVVDESSSDAGGGDSDSDSAGPAPPPAQTLQPEPQDSISQVGRGIFEWRVISGMGCRAQFGSLGQLLPLPHPQRPLSLRPACPETCLQ